uniref:Uncharacterized protein n=1 Tax=Oryza glaberrima TaxID=4538 RepID=I1QC37_ORYGL
SIGRTTTLLIEGRRVVGAAAIEHRRCQSVRRRIDGDANRSLEKQLPNKGTPAPLHAGALAAAAAAALAAACATDAGALASHPGTLLGAGAIEALGVEAHSASVAPVEPAATDLAAAGAGAALPPQRRRRGRGRRHHGELVLRVQRAPHLRREHGAERVHVEAARHAAVDEAPQGARRGAQVADAVVVGDAAEGEAVPRVRGEGGDRRLEVIGAGLVDVEVAGLAPEPDEAAEAGGAEVADMAGAAAVLAPHQDVLRVGAVSHKGGLKMCKYRCCKTWLACALAGYGYKCQTIEARNGIIWVWLLRNSNNCILGNQIIPSLYGEPFILNRIPS